jgi:hypothetical protein
MQFLRKLLHQDKSPWKEWKSCFALDVHGKICGNRKILFEPHPTRNIWGVPLLRIYHSGSEHIRCLGRCGAESNCPYCNGSQEMGTVICIKCRATYEGIRMRNGKVYILPGQMDIGPRYVPYLTVSEACAN